MALSQVLDALAELDKSSTLVVFANSCNKIDLHLLSDLFGALPAMLNKLLDEVCIELKDLQVVYHLFNGDTPVDQINRLWTKVSATLNVAVICVSRSMRSSTITTHYTPV